MNKTILTPVLVGLLVALSVALAEEEKTQNKATSITNKAMDKVSEAANKGAANVQKLANGVTVSVERFTNGNLDHQPGQSGLLVSAGKGVGRLLRNLTVEAGRYVGTVGGGAIKLAKHSTGAVAETIRDSANRIANPRRPGGKVQSSESIHEMASSSESVSDSSNANELSKQED